MFNYLFALFFFVTAVFAQNVDIGQPAFNQTVSPGSYFTVQVQRPVRPLRFPAENALLISFRFCSTQNSLTGSEEVAIAIGLQSCPNRPCTPPASFMGAILYNGPFNPQYHEGNLPPYQNFSVQVPSSTPAGTALVGVTHFTLIGVS